MSDEYACYVLASWAPRILNAISKACVAPEALPSDRRRIAGEINTHLMLIREYLDPLPPPYLVESDIEDLCQRLLHGLAGICSWPQPFRPVSLIRESHALFTKHFTYQVKSPRKDPIISFFRGTENKCRIDALNEDSLELYNKLDQDGIEDAEDLPTNLQQLDLKRYSANFSNSLFEAIESHTECDTSLHIFKTDHHKSPSSRHPARLCLSEHDHGSPSFNFLVSTMNMVYWQDFLLTIQAEDDPPSGSRLFPRQKFCELLELEPNARVPVLFKPPSGLSQIDKFQFLELVPRSGSGETLSSILRNYRLTPKNKVILAYTIAQAYWQFYDSELMRTKWTSETICFMSADVRGASPPDEMPLRPYLTFPFGIPSNPLQDVIHDDHLNHQHPRIFAIGVLLLGIGLAEPFPTISRRNQVSQVNGDHQIATNQLRELKTAKWDGFRYKSYFDSAVEHCLDGQRLVSRSEKPIKAGAAGPMLSTTRPDEQDGILRRRKSFYNNVVLPLKWLAEKGFGHGYQVIPCIRRNPAVPSPSAGILASLPQLEASFHSGRDVNPRMWLRDLNTISSEVERERRVYRAKRDGDVGTEFEVRTTAIRIAILDTGLDRSLLGFDLEDGRPSRVTREKDFVDGSSTADTFGHGTFMARLVMKCAPSAEIIVARVARDSEQLKVSQERVKEAILWAGIECKADVISMSFGFPKDDAGIDQAIQTVRSKRNRSVIFLASCGNSPSEDENFPARHPFVMSIYATNRHGVFAETNAQMRDDGPVVLGTYGDDLPTDLCTDISAVFPKICQSGSSVATAVAVGITATMLAYVNILPYLDGVEGRVDTSNERVDTSNERVDTSNERVDTSHERVGTSNERVLALLRETRGMEALFKAMARKKHDRRWFVDPIWFWRDTSEEASHFTRYCTIRSCMQEVNIKL